MTSSPPPSPPSDHPATPPERPQRWWALLVVGVLGGVMSGLFGVGGGILMVPLLILMAGLNQKQAATTSLAAIIPAALVGSATYLANDSVDVVVAGIVAVGGIAGSYVGARLLRRIPMAWLRWLFIALLVAVAIRMFLTVPERGADIELSPLVVLALVATGLFMGVASGLFGIGGGVILVPVLIALFGQGDLAAKGTSLLTMLPTAIMGTVTNLRGRMVDLRAGAVVGLGATVASFGGASLAFLLPPRASTVLFALLVVVAATQLTVRAIRMQRGGR
ncbi:sulfite exporter TauE/SafE family protein [Actinotalea sp. Marseille-Q4924]|uniref:sulfite exporter TauE/SafE family protein n=1 Tax=Actinotalea sp. Marseille-Q4924 TaxID=2866571 RepID=UPI001CE43B11|nr:sulfite exporter TauE/SafE family protein [Actinotalea sp. Marseille-Q4924]